MRVLLRPTIPSDLAFVSDAPLPCRIRAITGLLDGEVIGIGALVFRPDGQVWISLKISDEARRCKVTLHKAALMLIGQAREAGIRRLWSELDADEPGASAWHERLGFRLYGGVWVLDL